MRALALIAVVAAGAGAARAAESRGLDHRAHRARMQAAGSPGSGCADCHAIDPAGRLRRSPDHKTCFARCHAPAPPPRRRGRPYPVDAGRRPLCLVCHAAADLDAAIAGGRDKLAASRGAASRADYRLTMSHESHAAAGCADCHKLGRTSRPHERCRGCHARAPVAGKLPMSGCDRCHRPARPNSRGLGSEPSPYTTRETFSHQRHAPRVQAARLAPCVSCHAGLDKLAGNKVPRPRKSACVTCHDGKTAFSTVAARCRDCHRRAQIPIGELSAASARYDHSAHDQIACVDCHPGGGSFDPAVGHTLCASSSCHGDDFDDRLPTLCRSCHLSNEPWLKQHVDPPVRGLGDFGVRFDHLSHRSRSERACAGCHVGDPDGPDVGLTTGHVGCAGPNCHDANKPAMSSCADCHALGARARRQRIAGERRWSVRRAFRHASHGKTPAGTSVACSRCHARATVRDAAMPRPRKATCLGCHDGKTAFKTTGHGCRRCHK